MSPSYIEFKIRLLNPKKATTHNNIPPKILESSYEATVNVLHKLFNETITEAVFQDKLKLADIISVFKKYDPLDEKQTTDLSAICRLYLKIIKNCCKDKQIII